jgi:hypothetical protein
MNASNHRKAPFDDEGYTMMLRAAAEILSAALSGQSAAHKGMSAAQIAASVPPECWPDQEMRAIAAAIAALETRGSVVDLVTVYDELRQVGAAVEAVRLSQLAAIASDTYIGDVHARAETLRRAFVRSEIQKRAQRLANTVFEIPDEDLEAVLADFAGATDLGTTHRLVPSDVLNAPEPPQPIFRAGPVRGTLSLIVAESGRSKSFLAMALSASVASGTDLVAPFAHNETGRVIYVSFEDPASIVRLRLARIGQAAGIDRGVVDAAISNKQLVFYCDIDGPFFEANRYGKVSHTRLFSELEMILRQARPVLLVIDPLSGAAAIADENSNAQVGIVAAALARLARQLDIVLLLVHHTGKAAAGAPGSQHAARGASALACRSRWIMQLSPRGGEENGQHLIEARVVKDSYHVPHDPVVMERCEGGALRRLDSAPISNETICRAALAWILANPGKPVTAMAIRNRLGAGAEAYTSIVHQLPAATAPAMLKAFRWGIEQRLFEEQPYKNAHRERKKRLTPGPAATGAWPTDDLQEDLCRSCSSL